MFLGTQTLSYLSNPGGAINHSMDKDEENKLVEMIKVGNIFIYPTDTVYGIGCNALNEESVLRIKEIKGRDAGKPLSVIAPSKDWIYSNLFADKGRVDKYLPGRYTLILKKKEKGFLDYVSSGETLGVRIPVHWFAGLVAKSGVPFITTSANLSGEKAAAELRDIAKEVLEKADVVINDGKLPGQPSTIVLENGEELKR